MGIRPNPVRLLKSKAAEREVPLHGVLEQLLDTALLKTGTLFPGLTVDKVVKRYAYLRRLHPELHRTVFHYTRKWFITQCERTGVGDGAMGFWAAMDEVYPETRHQRCWQHKTMNVLNCLPKLSQPKAKAALHDIWQAETKVDADKAFDLFIKTYEPKYPKATLCLQKDREELMAFFDFPAQHWQSIRTSNPIESAFATIRHRTKRSKGCLSRDGMLHMMFKLGQCAEQNWMELRGFDYLAKVNYDKSQTVWGVTFMRLEKFSSVGLSQRINLFFLVILLIAPLLGNVW